MPMYGGIELGGARPITYTDPKHVSRREASARYRAKKKAEQQAQSMALVPQGYQFVEKAPRRRRATVPVAVPIQEEVLPKPRKSRAKGPKQEPLYLKERIFGHPAETWRGKEIPATKHYKKNVKMTHADKVELSNWLASKGYGMSLGGADMLSELDDYELMAGGAKRRVGRPRKARGGDWKGILESALPLALSFL